MDALEAIRLRRSVRSYTDRPVADADLDQLLRLALMAPTGGMAQAWSLMVIRDPERRAALAEIVIAGGGAYFASVRPGPARPQRRRAPPVGRRLRQRGARQLSPRAGLDPRPGRPPQRVPARGPRHRGPWPTTCRSPSRWRTCSWPRGPRGWGPCRRCSTGTTNPPCATLVGLPDEIRIPIVTPLGYPTEFPVGLPPRLKELRRPWRTLVHDEQWGNTRAR